MRTHMNTYPCCGFAASDSGTAVFLAQSRSSRSQPRTIARRCLDIAGWIVPGAILAVLPKCPACLAAYVAVGTGVGLSLSTATHLRAALLILSIASLLYLVATRLGRSGVVTETLFSAKSHGSVNRRLRRTSTERGTEGNEG